MDLDEYDHVAKIEDEPELLKSKERVNGSEEITISEEITKTKDKERKKSSKHVFDKKDDSHRLKPSNNHDRDKVSSCHRSSPRDGESSDRDKCRSSRNRRERGKDREKKELDGKDRDQSRVRDTERGCRENRRDHRNDYQKERESGELRQSRRQPERHIDRGDIERSQDKDCREKENKRVRGEVVRGSRRQKEKKEEKAEPKVDPERDQRTVFAYQICLKADERDVYDFFSRAGKVRDVRLISDRISRRSKGVGYIEFYDAMSVPMAIALSGQPLLGQPVMVKPSEAEKNLVQSSSTAVGGAGEVLGPYSGGTRRLYVGNLHYSLDEDQIRQVFEPFGSVETVELPIDPETGSRKGYGFIQFVRLEDARAALCLDGQLEIAGQEIKVSFVADQAVRQDDAIQPGDFDDDMGLSLNDRSRGLLIQNLDGIGSTESLVTSLPAAPVLVTASAISPIVALASLSGTALSVPPITVPSIDSVGVPSECLLLKNMFDPQLEEEPNFDLDIRDDVQDECEKYGALKHIFVEKNSAGFVYLQFGNTESAVSAQRALHGRWFAGKMITATFMVPQTYEAKFPESK